MTTDRVQALTSLAQQDSLLISQLDTEISDAKVQANELRARGMVSKALELEESVAARASSQRAAAITRINEGSLEIAHIKSSVTKAASLPELLAHFLCLGFAMSLEIVPALILSGVRSSGRSIKPVVDSEDSASPPLVIEQLETPKTPETLLDTNAEILKTLVDQAKTTMPGTPIKLKEFAKTSRIGNLRACEIFRNAEALGVIKKTTIGYVST
ncbi:hypothetical protein JFV26_27445 [Pseudomonas sp. TH31]|nr:hypothetical protein [Pseudomonas sp. TH31]